MAKVIDEMEVLAFQVQYVSEEIEIIGDEGPKIIYLLAPQSQKSLVVFHDPQCSIQTFSMQIRKLLDILEPPETR